MPYRDLWYEVYVYSFKNNFCDFNECFISFDQTKMKHKKELPQQTSLKKIGSKRRGEDQPRILPEIYVVQKRELS